MVVMKWKLSSFTIGAHSCIGFVFQLCVSLVRACDLKHLQAFLAPILLHHAKSHEGHESREGNEGGEEGGCTSPSPSDEGHEGYEVNRLEYDMVDWPAKISDLLKCFSFLCSSEQVL